MKEELGEKLQNERREEEEKLKMKEQRKKRN